VAARGNHEPERDFPAQALAADAAINSTTAEAAAPRLQKSFPLIVSIGSASGNARRPDRPGRCGLSGPPSLGMLAA